MKELIGYQKKGINKVVFIIHNNEFIHLDTFERKEATFFEDNEEFEPVYSAWDKLGEDTRTKEEKEKFFEEHYSPLIRYGYSEAINELMEFIINEENHEYSETYKDHILKLPKVQDKLLNMMKNKKKVNQVELMKAFVEAKAENLKKES